LIVKVLRAIGKNKGSFMFIGTDGWGRRQEIITGDGMTDLEGSLVLSQEIASDQEFEAYFKALGVTSADSAAVKVNPWLAQFWEARLNCYLNKSFK
jgi:hypothetical protein